MGIRRHRSTSLVSVAVLAVAVVVAVTGAGCGSSEGDSQDPDGEGNSARRAAVAAFQCPVDGSDVGADGIETGATSPEGPRRALRVVTTVAPITSIVANVAGDRVEVEGVIPEGEDSHTYEPKPRVAEVLATADLVFVNGLQLEDPTRELAEANLADGAEVIELGTLALTEDQYLYDFSFPESEGKPNPHLWTNPPMAGCYATLAAVALANADPRGADGYRANAEAYNERVGALDQAMVAATASVPAANRKLLTYHDAYAYFAARYGWTVIGAIQVSSFEDPTAKEVASLIEQVERAAVPAIFGSEVFPSDVLSQIGREAGVDYVDALRDDDLPGGPGDRGHSLLGLLQFDFVTMVEALGGDAEGLGAFDPSDVVADTATYPQ